MTCFNPPNADVSNDSNHGQVDGPSSANNNNNNPSSSSEIPSITLDWAIHLMIMQQIERQLQPLQSDLFSMSQTCTITQNAGTEHTLNRLDDNDDSSHHDPTTMEVSTLAESYGL
jgi:hypothetical protein